MLDSDVSLVTQLWHDLVDKRKPVSTEFRFRAPWIDKSGVTGETWVLFSAYPETHDDGSLKSVFGSITNISSQKWAEGLQKRKMEEVSLQFPLDPLYYFRNICHGITETCSTTY